MEPLHSEAFAFGHEGSIAATLRPCRQGARRAKIGSMRRFCAALLLTVLAAAAGLRLGAAAADTEAMRCAIACGHAAAAVNGAACCPMSNAPGAGPSFKACLPERAALAPIVSGQSLLLTGIVRILRPDSSCLFDGVATAAPISASPRPVDHVPLLLG